MYEDLEQLFVEEDLYIDFGGLRILFLFHTVVVSEDNGLGLPSKVDRMRWVRTFWPQPGYGPPVTDRIVTLALFSVLDL